MKYEVIKFYDNAGMQPTLDRFFQGLEEKKRESKHKLVYQWIGLRSRIEELAKSAKYRHKLYYRGLGHGIALTTMIEENIAHWVLELRGEGIPVTRLLPTP